MTDPKKRAKPKPGSTKSSAKNPSAKSSSARRPKKDEDEDEDGEVDDDEGSGERSSSSKSSRAKKGGPKGGDSKVLVIKITFGVFLLLLLAVIYKVASKPPPPPPPKVINHGDDLKVAQQYAKDGYKKGTEGHACWNTDRQKGERLIRAAIEDFDKALKIYDDLFEKYPGEKYEYLGPEVDRMQATKMQYRKMLPVH